MAIVWPILQKIIQRGTVRIQSNLTTINKIGVQKYVTSHLSFRNGFQQDLVDMKTAITESEVYFYFILLIVLPKGDDLNFTLNDTQQP